MTTDSDTNPASGKDQQGKQEKPPASGERSGNDPVRKALEKNRDGSPARTRGGALRVFMLLFNLLLLAAIGYTGYMVYEQGKAVDVLFEQQNSFAQDRNAAGDRITALQGTIEMLEAALAAAREETQALLASQNTELQRLQDEIVSTRLRISDDGTSSGRQWLLAEAASLLRMAEQQLIAGRNVRTAIALFVAADDILRGIDDPAIFPIRESLATELAALRAVPEIDIQGIYARLGGVLDQLGSLQVNGDLENQVASGERVGADADGEEGFLAAARALLNDYVVVRRRDAPIQPLLSPEQEFALMQSIRLQIEQARTALLRGRQEIYADSLGNARDNVATYLGGDAAAKTSVLDTLDGLRERDIVAAVPPVSVARTALERILAVTSAGDEAEGD